MSVNDSIDPRFLYHVEEESLQFRVGESAHKSRELETDGDRCFAISGIQQNFGGSRIEKDEMRYSDGDDGEDDICDSGNNRSSVAAETNRGSKNAGIHTLYISSNFFWSFDLLLRLSQTKDC